MNKDPQKIDIIVDRYMFKELDEIKKSLNYKFTDKLVNAMIDSTNVRTAVRLMQPYGAAYAYTDHIGIQRHIQEIVLRTDESSINSILWGMLHEAGHQMDIDAREWAEVTNNMWANNAYIKNGLNDRVQYDKLYKYLAPEKSLKTYEELDYSEKLGMFWQLQIKKNT